MNEIITFLVLHSQPAGRCRQTEPVSFCKSLRASKIKLQGISASADRSRFKTYCAPEDPAKLRGFLKSVKIPSRSAWHFSSNTQT